VKIIPRLAWQGSLIVLPVAMLAGFALNFLREDKASIEQEARTRAQALAPELEQRFARRATALFRGSGAAFEGVVENGRILVPLDYPRLPSPAAWPNRLTPEQARSWNAAQGALYRQPDDAAARGTLQALTSTGAPAALRANAELALLRVDSAAGLTERVARRSLELARGSHGIPTESGAPLSDVALLIRLGDRLRAPLDRATLAAVGASAREHPSFLTAEIIEAALAAAPPDLASDVQAIRANWDADERTRDLLAAIPQARAEKHGSKMAVSDSWRSRPLKARGGECAFTPAPSWTGPSRTRSKRIGSNSRRMPRHRSVWAAGASQRSRAPRHHWPQRPDI
jgi:hypothetical protein